MLKTYHVFLAKAATPGIPEEQVTVLYQDVDYKAAWVGARTVCRLGTNERRVFKVADGRAFADADPFSCRAGLYTVKHILVDGTRKKGKQRMTTISGEDLLNLIEAHAPTASPELKEELTRALEGTGGVRITLASARRLGITEG